MSLLGTNKHCSLALKLGMLMWHLGLYDLIISHIACVYTHTLYDAYIYCIIGIYIYTYPCVYTLHTTKHVECMYKHVCMYEDLYTCIGMSMGMRVN